MLLLPCCKINIGLRVVARREDGYHELETVFYPIPLRDNLEIKPLEDDSAPFRLTVHGAPVAGRAEENLVVRVFMDMKREFDLPALDIFLYKSIPMGAGLGGGSSDAASMLTGLNEMFDLRLTNDEMERRVSRYGADCAFFIKGKPAFATGIGDELAPLPLSLAGKWIVLVKPDVFVSTKEAYAQVKPRRPQNDLRQAVLAPIELWRHSVVNDFEASVFPAHPELAAIKQTLYDMGALYAAMSGSGSTVFALFDRPADEAKHVFAKHFVFMKKLIG